MKNFLPKEYKKNRKLKINHSYMVEQFADYTKIFKEVEINVQFLNINIILILV